MASDEAKLTAQDVSRKQKTPAKYSGPNATRHALRPLPSDFI